MDCKDENDKHISLWLCGRGENSPTTPGDAARLIRHAREEAGLPPWEETEADCFQSGNQLLILARPVSARPHGFYFPDLESLLGAVFACPPRDSALYSMREGFLLVFPQIPDFLPLHEFGSDFPLHPLWEIHAREQGLCILPQNAMANLLLVYSTKGM